MTANQMYKQSGSGLPFKQWLEREKTKGVVIPQKGVTDAYANYVDNEINNKDLEVVDNKNRIVGLNKPILVVSLLLILGAIGYTYYRKNRWFLN